MKVDTHWKNVKESQEVLEECIEKGLEERQRTIGFSTSVAANNLFEILLHKLNLINHGSIIKHEWLKSKNKILEKFPFNFPKKAEILDLMFKIEEKRNLLCYGKPQKKEVLQEVINNFNKLKEIFKEAGLHELQ